MLASKKMSAALRQRLLERTGERWVSEQRIVFFDLETTGIDEYDPRRYPIIQFAAVATDAKNLAELDRVSVRIKLYHKDEWQPVALSSNAFGQETGFVWREGMPGEAVQEHFAECAAQWNKTALSRVEAFAAVNEFIERHRTVPKVGRSGRPYRVARMAGHNVATFDMPRLRAFYGGRFCPCAYKCLDTYQLACWTAYLEHGTEDVELSLGALMLKHGISREGAAHDALSDVLGTVELARRLMFRLTSGHRERPI